MLPELSLYYVMQKETGLAGLFTWSSPRTIRNGPHVWAASSVSLGQVHWLLLTISWPDSEVSGQAASAELQTLAAVARIRRGRHRSGMPKTDESFQVGEKSVGISRVFGNAEPVIPKLDEKALVL